MNDDGNMDYILEAVKVTCDDGDWPYPPDLEEWLEKKAGDARA